MHQSNTINNIEYKNKKSMNARDKLITCYHKAELSLTQISTIILSSLLGKRMVYCECTQTIALLTKTLCSINTHYQEQITLFILYMDLLLIASQIWQLVTTNLLYNQYIHIELLSKVCRDSKNMLFSPLASAIHHLHLRGS